jgi:hypothetical protein
MTGVVPQVRVVGGMTALEPLTLGRGVDDGGRVPSTCSDARITALADSLTAALGADLVGLYLYGSAVSGGCTHTSGLHDGGTLRA